MTREVAFNAQGAAALFGLIETSNLPLHQASSETGLRQIVNAINRDKATRTFCESLARALNCAFSESHGDAGYWCKLVVAANAPAPNGRIDSLYTDNEYNLYFSASTVTPMKLISNTSFLAAAILVRMFWVDLFDVRRLIDAVLTEIDAANPSNHKISSS